MQVQITVIYLTMSEKINPQPALLGADPTRDEKKLINSHSVHNQSNFQLNIFHVRPFALREGRSREVDH